MTDTVANARPADANPERSLPPMRAEWTSVTAAIFDATRRDPNGRCAADSSETRIKEGTEDQKELIYLTRQEVLARAAAIAHVLAPRLDPEAQCVAVLLPPSLNCTAVNVALLMLKKIPVNLNFATKSDIVNHCIGVCGAKDAIGIPVLLKRTKVEPKANVIDAGELKAAVTDEVRAWAAAALAATPEEQAKHFPGLTAALDDVAAIIFTSGSTNLPKGVEHTHRSLLSNVRGVQAMFAFGIEKLLAAGPAFHVMGFTGCIVAPLALGKDTNAEGEERSITVVYHANPLDAKTICALIQSEQITLFLSIPSMMRMYVARATKEQFASLKHVILGAEKLEEPLRVELKERFGIDAEEAFGCTELGPLASANVNAWVEIGGKKIWGNRPGSVGLMMPDTCVKILDMNTNQELPRGEKHFGWIMLWGPQRMLQYSNNPAKTAEALKDGWYFPGDYGYVDEDGFLWFLGRLVIKSAGEMIPPLAVRGKILEICGVDESQLYVVGAKDTKRGERPAVLYVSLGGKTPAEITAALQDKIPALWIPKANDYAQVDALPVGPTGKLDLVALNNLAAEKFAAE